VSAVGSDPPSAYNRVDEPTSVHVWHCVAGGPITDELLEWPPDLFALTNVVLTRSEAFRFALSRGGDWPPARYGDWSLAVEEAGRQWSAWVEDRVSRVHALPGQLRTHWSPTNSRS